MNIVVDFRKYDGVVGGVEQVVKQILSRVVTQGHKIVLLSKANRTEEVKDIFKNYSSIKHIGLAVASHAISAKNAYLDSVTIQKIAEAEGAQVIHFPYNWSFPFVKKVPTILTIHDVIPFTFREAMGFFRNKLLYKPSLRLACKLNTTITTISEFSKQDIAAKTGVNAEKIRVISNGFRQRYPLNEAMTEELKDKFDLRRGFVLNVGGIHERKNIVRLIYAFARFVEKTKFAGKLVVTGSVGGSDYRTKMKQLCDRAVDEAGMKEKVVFTGFISDEELDQLMRQAEFLVYPSLYEGFGIPILEAMNAELPVITSDATATKEIADDAALLVDPYNVEEIASAMAKLLGNKQLADELNVKAKKIVARYSWEELSQEYLRLYQELSGDGKPARN